MTYTSLCQKTLVFGASKRWRAAARVAAGDPVWGEGGEKSQNLVLTDVQHVSNDFKKKNKKKNFNIF